MTCHPVLAQAKTGRGLLVSTLQGILMVALLWGLTACGTTTLQASTEYQTVSPSSDGIGRVYLGREIAQTMGHEGAGWLDRPSRVLQERPQIAIAALDLAPSDTVADIGAGTGYFARRIAPLVPQGKVLAVDIQPEMLALLQTELEARGIDNVELVLGQPDSPNLPPNSIDLALMVDAYHEFDYPREMMQGVVAALKPGGRVVLAEYRAENPMVMIKRLHKMTVAQVRREMAAVGLEWIKTDDRLPEQHLLFFQRSAQGPA
ncbi:class I SAM-dependent methyltransferase [Nodosilinea sp. E11]|uniref:class I SAM-dependent methyltransferase n=1 Tax=Nodosilinea sp. E11 TaxID=3037479 RepID=UPI002934C217|nr:class I SAM-dependent methyltransferase [Nodosilinea sp. E11]WOD39441.1 class I SAM-dependent methyltransferase [Nodosilinea sp. E11]